MNRRELLMLSAGAVPFRAAGTTETAGWASPEFDVPRPELVLELIVTCSKPEPPGPEILSKDGQRKSIWPIVGGKFVGQDIRGVVVPGGGDFPLVRPDGVTVIDALYRLLTDDGITILIHNKGISIGADEPGGRRRYRLSPEFTAPLGKYEWLNKGVFIANLTTNVPNERRLARSENENDRLIHVYRLT